MGRDGVCDGEGPGLVDGVRVEVHGADVLRDHGQHDRTGVGDVLCAGGDADASGVGAGEIVQGGLHDIKYVDEHF